MSKILLCNRNSIEICQLSEKCQAHLTVLDKRSKFIALVIDPHKRRRLCCLEENTCSQIPFRCNTLLLIKQQIAQFLLHQATGANCPIRTYTHDDQIVSDDNMA